MLSCPRCHANDIPTYSNLVTHVVIYHGSEPNFSISCNVPTANGNCCSVFHSSASYKSHMYKFHSVLLTGCLYDTTFRVQILCLICNQPYNSLRELSSHYRVHCDRGVSVPCTVKFCTDVFNVFSSYTSHMTRKHRNICLDHVRDECKQIVDVSVVDDMDIDETVVHNAIEARDISDNVDMPLLVRSIALLLLKMKCEYSIPESTVQLFIDDFSNIADLSNCVIKQRIINMSMQYNWSSEAIRDLCAVVDDSFWIKAIERLSTQCRRNTYYKENLPYIAPVEYKFIDACDCKDSFQYIPMLETIPAVLKDACIKQQLLNPSPTVNGIIQSFRDGSVYRDHSVFSSHEIALQLIIYSDEFEVVNPLGPHKKKHKMMAFYLLIGNLSNVIKSQKSAILLVALLKSAHVKKYGLTKIAEVMNKELVLMENEGFSVVGYPHKIFGALAFIAGDNLNSHLIGGFNASFSPNVQHPCRYCLISNEELQKCDSASTLKLRTKANYDMQAAEVMIDASKSTEYGIRYASPFISGSFHVVDGLPPDIMHDMLEGIVPFEMALVLKKLVENKCFTISELNAIISLWNYGPLDKCDKPVPIPDPPCDTVKQNAGRTWCLLRLLPLMIGHKVKSTNSCFKFWTFLLDLRAIVEMVFALHLAVGHVLHLQAMIQDHIANFILLFPDKKVRPKQHFLLHYGQYFLSHGPLRACWCMRFEAKHSYFTHLMSVVKNYKHACSTLAQRHQLKLAYELATGGKFLQHDLSFSSTTVEDMDYLADSVVHALRQNGVSLLKQLNRCSKFVKVNGITYYCKMYVVLNVVDDTPVLGRIDNIYIQDMICHFLTRVCYTQFEAHVGCYRIQPSDNVVCCTVDDLLDFYPLTGYIVGNQRLVAMKHFLYDRSLYES